MVYLRDLWDAVASKLRKFVVCLAFNFVYEDEGRLWDTYVRH